MDPSTVLVVQHERDAPAGWLGERLGERGCRLDVRHPYAGDALPAGLSASPGSPGSPGYAGVLVLGGAMDSWDDAGFDWLAPTRALVREAEATGVPTLGLCLGHQLASLALGGRVGRNPSGPTVGLRAVGWADTAAADPLLGPSVDAREVVHWNSDAALELPPGATVLARTGDGAVQAARLGRTVWGVQGHPEVDEEIVGWWVEAELPRLTDEAQRSELLALVRETGEAQAALRRAWTPLADAFAALVRERGAGR